MNLEEIWGLNNSINEIKKNKENFNRRLDQAKGQISKLEDVSFEIPQSTPPLQKKKKENK